MSFHNPDPKIIDVLFLFRVSACILFYSSPFFSFFLRCSFGLPSVISCRNTHIYIYIHRIWMNMVHLLIQWLPYLVICRGDPLVNFKLSSLMMKNVVQNWAIWETHFFPQSWSKSYPEPKTQDPKPPILNMHSDFKTPWTTKIQNYPRPGYLNRMGGLKPLLK